MMPYIKNSSVGKKINKTEERTHILFSQQLREIGESIDHIPELKEDTDKIFELAEDAEHPLLVVIMGEFNTGKSTFINALLNEEVVTVDATPATAIVTLLSFGEKRELLAHFQDGTVEILPYDKLKNLSAEGNEEGNKIRVNLKYIEVRLPNDLLKKITLIDTPGLNSQNQAHTKVTEDFMNRADQIFWLFSYRNVGRNTERERLKKFSEYLKPIGIINHIDEHDMEEEDLTIDEFLTEAHRSIGGVVTQLLGVSAKKALEGKRSGDSTVLEDSRWADVEQMINQDLIKQAGRKKIKLLVQKTLVVLKNLSKTIASGLSLYEIANNNIREIEYRVQELKDVSRILAKQNKLWSLYTKNDALFAMREQFDLPNILEGNEKLNRYKKRLFESLMEITRSNYELKRDDHSLSLQIQSHNERYDILEGNIKNYLYNKNFLDTNYSENYPVLESTETDLNETGQILNRKKEQLRIKSKDLTNRLGRFHEESNEIIKTVISLYEGGLEELSEQVSRLVGKMEIYKRKQCFDLFWYQEAETILNYFISSKVNMLIYAVEREIGQEKEISYYHNQVDTFTNVYKKMERLLKGFKDDIK